MQLFRQQGVVDNMMGANTGYIRAIKGRKSEISNCTNCQSILLYSYGYVLYFMDIILHTCLHLAAGTTYLVLSYEWYSNLHWWWSLSQWKKKQNVCDLAHRLRHSLAVIAYRLSAQNRLVNIWNEAGIIHVSYEEVSVVEISYLLDHFTKVSENLSLVSRQYMILTHDDISCMKVTLVIHSVYCIHFNNEQHSGTPMLVREHGTSIKESNEPSIHAWKINHIYTEIAHKHNSFEAYENAIK